MMRHSTAVIHDQHQFVACVVRVLRRVLAVNAVTDDATHAVCTRRGSRPWVKAGMDEMRAMLAKLP